MKKLNIVSNQEGDLRLQGGDIIYLDEKVTSDNQSNFVTLKDLEENLVLRNWNIWPRVFIYDNCLYYSFNQTFNFPSTPINPQVYSNFSYASSVKFSTARKLTSIKKVTNANTISPFAPPSQETTSLLMAPSRAPKDYSVVVNTDTTAATTVDSSSSQAVVSDKNFNIKYSSVVTEEIIDGKKVTFSELYSEIMNLVDGENDTGVSMYYHLSSLYDLIKKSGVVEVIAPGSSVYTSAINLSKYVRDNCICHVTVSYLSDGLEGQEQIKFSPCKLSPEGELKPLSERFEVLDDNLTSLCVIECQDFCVRVFPGSTDECIINNCYITYEN